MLLEHVYSESEIVLDLNCCCIFREDPQSRLAKTAVTSSPYKSPEKPRPAQEERVEPQEEDPPPRKNMILYIPRSLIVDKDPHFWFVDEAEN